jgi:hypothetical protein
MELNKFAKAKRISLAPIKISPILSRDEKRNDRVVAQTEYLAFI